MFLYDFLDNGRRVLLPWYGFLHTGTTMFYNNTVSCNAKLNYRIIK